MRHLLPLLAVVLVGCGPAATGSRGEQLPPAVSAAPTLLPDGTVPWVDEPAGQREYDLQLPVPPSIAGARPCRAGDLDAVLPGWTRQGDGGEPDARRPAPGLYGYVAVTLRGDTPCTLQGKAAVRLLIDGVEPLVEYSDSVLDEAVRRVSTVTRERGAELRVDWSPPFCDPPGTQELVVTLPDDGGELRAAVREPAVPTCVRGGSEGATGLRTYVTGAVFDAARVETPLDSPLRVLRATAQEVPTSAPAGGAVDYLVRLSNPTDRDVALDPCPGYLQERFVQGTGGATGFNTSQVYRLNCRPVTAVPAGGSVAFRMRARVPADPPGPQYSVTWRLLAPRLAGEDALRLGFQLPVLR